MTSPGPATEPATPPAPPAPVATYRYLRLSVAGLAVVLGLSVGAEALTGSDGWLDSISAYYYSPVRDVFVGVLMATALGLVAVRGRDRGGEEVMLNLAGLLAPVVAVVPTPLGGEVPAAYVEGVDDNVRTLLAAGGLTLLIAWVVLARRAPPRATVVGLGVASLVVAGGVAAFVLAHDAFLRTAHYGAAVVMFLLMVAVAVLNAVATRRRRFRPAYLAIAVTMLAVVVAAGVLARRGTTGPWLLVVEALLLGLFASFWAVQTWELWDEGTRPGASGRRSSVGS